MAYIIQAGYRVGYHVLAKKRCIGLIIDYILYIITLGYHEESHIRFIRHLVTVPSHVLQLLHRHLLLSAVCCCATCKHPRPSP